MLRGRISACASVSRVVKSSSIRRARPRIANEWSPETPSNTAARLQAAADSGSIVVGVRTHAATNAVVEYADLGALAVKGKTDPVRAWRAVGVRARRGGFRAPVGLESSLVGRETEMALLKETVRRTATDQRPHLVTIVGSPGVGKSRLRWELEKYLDGLPETFVWRQGRSYAYAQASLGALVEMVQADAGIREDETATSAADRLDQRLAELPRPTGGRDRELLRGVLGIDSMPKATPDELFGALTRHLESLARVAPAVLVFEDIHWADDSVLDFIESLARWGTGRLLLLCLARHELLERRPGLGGRHKQCDDDRARATRRRRHSTIARWHWLRRHPPRAS